MAEENPNAVEDLVPKLLSLGIVQKILKNLLRERVSIRDANAIMEALGEAAGMSRNPVLRGDQTPENVEPATADRIAELVLGAIPVQKNGEDAVLLQESN